MIFLKTKQAWGKYVKLSKEFYNLKELNINQKPQEYPCLAERYLTKDINGISLKFIFVYKNDIKDFK